MPCGRTRSAPQRGEPFLEPGDRGTASTDAALRAALRQTSVERRERATRLRQIPPSVRGGRRAADSSQQSVDSALAIGQSWPAAARRVPGGHPPLHPAAPVIGGEDQPTVIQRLQPGELAGVKAVYAKPFRHASRRSSRARFGRRPR